MVSLSEHHGADDGAPVRIVALNQQHPLQRAHDPGVVIEHEKNGP